MGEENKAFQCVRKCIKKDDSHKSRVLTSEQMRDKYSSTNTMTERLVSPTPILLVSVDLPLCLRPVSLLKGPPEARWAPGFAGHDLTMLAVNKDKTRDANFLTWIKELKR